MSKGGMKRTRTDSFRCAYLLRLSGSRHLQVWVPSMSDSGPGTDDVLDPLMGWMHAHRDRSVVTWHVYVGEISNHSAGYVRPMLTIAAKRPAPSKGSDWSEKIGKRVAMGTWDEAFPAFEAHARMI